MTRNSPLAKARTFTAFLVIAAAVAAYHNSFTTAFVLDDFGSILQNPTIRRLWPIGQCLSPPRQGGITVEGRPLVNLSLAINYALGGYNVWGYHALNLAVHIVAGLTLLGIVRRTLLQPSLRERFGAAANELALATAVLWIVHPLQTEAVTYIVQRAESIMGLFYLLTLYCFIRGTGSQRAGLWYGLSVTACGLGMATKEVMVSAPLMVMLYDRAFVAGSFQDAWRRRWPLYLGLTATWILLGYLATLTVRNALTNAQRFGLNRWEYLATQPGVILYYLRLSVWPSPLCVNHPWPLARTWTSILPPAVVVLILLGAVAWGWRRNPAWGFVGAWFFVILAPSSSFIPLLAPILEHRMYLPLAAVVSLAVIGLYSLAQTSESGPAARHSLAVFVVVAIGLGFLTWRRNQDYRSELTFWRDAVTKFPNDPLGHCNFGEALERARRLPEAMAQYEQALRLNPNIAEAHCTLAADLWQAGKTQEAIGHYERALRIKPDFAEAHAGLGITLKRMGRLPEAINHYKQALRIRPDLADAHDILGVALLQIGRAPEAMGHWEQALRIKPDDAGAHNNLGVALAQAGKFDDAIGHYEQALRIKFDFAEVHYGLGVALERTGKLEEGIGHLEQAVRLRPNFAEAQKRLERLRAELALRTVGNARTTR